MGRSCLGPMAIRSRWYSAESQESFWKRLVGTEVGLKVHFSAIIMVSLADYWKTSSVCCPHLSLDLDFNKTTNILSAGNNFIIYHYPSLFDQSHLLCLHPWMTSSQTPLQTVYEPSACKAEHLPRSTGYLCCFFSGVPVMPPPSSSATHFQGFPVLEIVR